MRRNLIGKSVLLVLIAGMMCIPAMAQGQGQGQGQGRGGGGAGRGAGGGGGRGGGGGIVTLTVSSTSFPDGGEIPAKYTGGQGTSPALSWSGAPAGTMSYVLIMHDVDAAL